MLSENKINQFFEDIKYILSDDFNLESKLKLTKKIDDEEGLQRTNVIYLNTDCNLRCEYCYEGDSRKGLSDQVHLTSEGIDSFLKEISDREKNLVSTIVIMGGEPFLRFDLVEYIVNKCIKTSKGWGIALVTNGTLFTPKILDKFKHLLESCKLSKTFLSLEISYDGSGQHRRKWPDGSSSRDVVENCIDNLSNNNIPFKISYVVHRDNYKNVIIDAIRIFERWPSLQRFLVGFAFEDLDKALNSQMVGQRIRDELTPYFKELYKIYKKPICGLLCDVCGLCKRENFSGNSYLSPTTGISYDVKETKHKFHQF